MLNDFFSFSEKLGVKLNLKESGISGSLIRNILKAGIARQIWGNNGFYPILNSKDKSILVSLENLKSI